MFRALRLSITLVALSPPIALAQGSNTGIAVRFGTLGVGVELSRMLTDHIAARVAAHQFTYSRTQEQSDVTFDAQLKLQGLATLVDLYPGRRGAFHFTGGVMTAPAKVTATGVPNQGMIELNGSTYSQAEVGTLVADATFPSLNPYAGFGWGTPAGMGGRVRFLLDFGAVFAKPTVAMRATNAAVNAALAADLAAQQQQAQRDVEKYAKVFPVVQLGLIVRF